MSKSSPKPVKKCPWIPPPGKTHHQPDKTSTKPLPDLPSTSGPYNTHQETENCEEVHLSYLGSKTGAGGDHFNQNDLSNSVKNEMELIALHYNAVKQISQFLSMFFKSCGIQDKSIVESLLGIEEKYKKFIFESDELEYLVTLAENTLVEKERATKTSEMFTLKQALLAKLLDCYSILVTVLQVVTQKQYSQETSSFQKQHDLLKKELELSEKKAASQTAKIRDLERRFSILMSKANTFESFNCTLNQSVSDLQKQLLQKENQIKYLTNEIASKPVFQQADSDRERLLNIIEEVKKTSLAEKSALKKAIKIEKIRIDDMGSLIKKFERDFKKKDKMLFDLAAQRDKYKLHLTMSNNRCIEDKNKIEELKSSIASMEEQKDNHLKEAKDEIHQLQKSIESLNRTIEQKNTELETFKNNSKPIPLESNSQCGNLDDVIREIQKFSDLLFETKESFQVFQASTNGGRKNSQPGLLISIEEIKEHLLELKNCLLHKSTISTEKQNLQHLYEQSCKENARLKSEIVGMKMNQERNSTHFTSEDRGLEMELKLKNEENRRLLERERDLERQLNDVKENLQRKEVQSFKVYDLEKEFESRRAELNLLAREKDAKCRELQNKLQDLQKELDSKNAECEGLQRYVNMLKVSFHNVFGSS